MKTLFFDIEILPRAFGDSWITMSADKSAICCFGYMWKGEKIKSYDLLDAQNNRINDAYNEKKIIEFAHKQFSQADLIVTHYGDKFDIKYMRAKFLMYGLDPQVLKQPTRDTCLLSRRYFKFSSNRLGNLAKQFGLETKIDLPVTTWFDVIRGRPAAMKAMSTYCRQDVNVLFQVHEKIKHFFPNTVHAGLARGNDRDSCPECGSTDTICRGTRVKRSGKYRRYSCKDCGRIWDGTHKL